MTLRLPLSLKLNRRALARRDAFFALITRVLRPGAALAAFAADAFAFKNDEHDFARELLDRKSQMWIFRSNQRSFCGDFVIVDMSDPAPDRRRAFVIDLKQGARLRTGGGGAGVQLRNADRAVREIAEASGAIAVDAPVELLTGDRAQILERFSRRR